MVVSIVPIKIRGKKVKLEKGDEVSASLRLLAVDGEDVPPGSGEQSIIKNVMVGNFYKEPLGNFVVGELPNFTSPDEKKLYNLSGDLFFGAHRKDLVCEIPKSNVDKDIREGEIIQNQNGNVGCVVDTTSKPDVIAVDFNHPLSGKNIEVEFSIKDVFPAKDQLTEAPSCPMSEKIVEQMQKAKK